MPETTSSTRLGSSERVSASRLQRSGTMFVLPAPPWIEPTLAVVCSSMRPSGMCAIAWAAARIGGAARLGADAGVGGLSVELRGEAGSRSATR